MAQVGNAENAKLNGEWGKHVRKKFGWKRMTSKLRRAKEKVIILKLLSE